MHLYLDTADAAELERLLPNPLVYGVTTNPTLMKRAGLGWRGLPEFVRRVEGLGARAVQVQVRHPDAPSMLDDARRYLAWRGEIDVVVKVPATRAGFTAAAELSADGVAVTMTAVYEPEQVLWSALVGARYAAPYLGRLDDAGRDGRAVVAEMETVLRGYASGDLRLLVASVRSREAFHDLLRIGVGAVTVPPSLFDSLQDPSATLAAEAAFLADGRAVDPPA
jgi:transaldolase